MRAQNLKWLMLGVLLLAGFVLAVAAARAGVKPCTGVCDDGDGPSRSVGTPTQVIDPGPPPDIDTGGDQPPDPDPAPAPTTTVPQSVTTPTVTTSGGATTVNQPAPAPAPPPPPPSACSNLPGLTSVPATMNRDASGVCTPKCLNHPDYTAVPEGWTVDHGSCLPPRGEDNFGLCKGDQWLLTAKSKVAGLLDSGYAMGIWVDGVRPDLHGNCIITDLTTYGYNPGDYIFSGKYVQDGGPADGVFDTPTPYPGMGPLYPYWVPKPQAVLFVYKQSLPSIQAYGLLWGGKRYANAASFAKLLRKQGGTWKGWKKNHPAFAIELVVHQRLMRVLK